MHFCLVDRVLECSPRRILATKQVSLAEEYLQDHFPGFPVLPGVLILEAFVQATRVLVGHVWPGGASLVLGRVRALRYGRFVPPGATLRIEVATADGSDLTPASAEHAIEQVEFRGEALVLDAGAAGPGAMAASGRFSLRLPRLIPSP